MEDGSRQLLRLVFSGGFAFMPRVFAGGLGNVLNWNSSEFLATSDSCSKSPACFKPGNSPLRIFDRGSVESRLIFVLLTNFGLEMSWVVMLDARLACEARFGGFGRMTTDIGREGRPGDGTGALGGAMTGALTCALSGLLTGALTGTLRGVLTGVFVGTLAAALTGALVCTTMSRLLKTRTGSSVNVSGIIASAESVLHILTL